MEQYKKFNFLSYTFSDNVYELIEYLEENNIKYKKTKKKIIFSIKIDNVMNPFKAIAIIKNDAVLDLTISNTIDSEEDYNIVISYLESNYKFLFKRNEGLEREYLADCYYFYLKRNGYNMSIRIEFYPKQIKENSNDGFVTTIILLVLGLLLSIGSYILNYFFNDNNVLKIILSIICFIDGVIQLYYFITLEKDWNFSKKLLVAICGIIAFCLVIFAAICIFATAQNLGFNIDYIYWSTYSASAIFPIIGLVCLFIVGLGYA